MGVQVGLEFYRQSPKRLTHLALTNGTFGRPLRGVAFPFSEQALGPLVRQVGKLHAWGSVVLEGVSRSPLSYHALRTLGVIAAGLGREHYQTMIRDFKSIDLRIYFQLLDQLTVHDAHPFLHTIDRPTLVIAGSRDVLTPPHLARTIAETIPGAELMVLTDATHYAAVEYPQLIAGRMEKFISNETAKHPRQSTHSKDLACGSLPEPSPRATPAP